MNLQRKTYTTRREKVVDFLIGMFGWHLANVLLGGVGFALAASAPDQLSSAAGIVFAVLGCVAAVGNLAALIYYGLTRHWIVFGFLAGIVAVLAPCFGLFWWLSTSNFSLV